MKKAKIVTKAKKEDKKEITESYSLKDLLKIVLTLLIVFAVFYFITVLVVKPNNNNSGHDNSNVQIDSSKITISNLLNRSESEYYVLATKASLYEGISSKMNYSEIYNKYISDYKSKDDSSKFYEVDLDDAFNKRYLSDDLNISDDLEEMQINDEVLFKISNHKIEAYYVGSDSIIKALSSL